MTRAGDGQKLGYALDYRKNQEVEKGHFLAFLIRYLGQ